MKLLFDQNISHRVQESLGDIYPDAAHVRLLGLERAGDQTLWNFARDHGFTIVSKDSDFHQRSLLFGFPPKFIWLRVGNCSTGAIEEILIRRQKSVRDFCEDTEHSFLILSRE